MSRKIISLWCTFVLIFTILAPSFYALATDAKPINRGSELEAAFQSKDNVDYYLAGNISISNMGIVTDTVLDGKSLTIKSVERGAGATIYQNVYVNSKFNNVTIMGNVKDDVGIWVSSGFMTFNNSKIYNYTINTVNQAAVALGAGGTLTLNDTVLSSNSRYDIAMNDTSILNINGKTKLDSIRLRSNYATINIGADWSGEFTITIENPVLKAIGTVADGADISNIKISNEGYYLANENGILKLKSTNERAIRFDAAQKDLLYKGSTGFLYGASEINVPSIDLLQGLKPDTMVQKAIGGLQHPTGDATRTKSALLSAGVRDMQIYFQDMYLEWPYDAPMKNGTIDIDSYQKSVEKIVYNMVCDRASKSDKDAFLATDGNYYKLNADNASKYSYVLFNEPDQIWFGGNLQCLEAAWKQLYNAVHKIDANARCVGPNYSGFNANDYNNFLKYCCENNCLPEIISWHELGDISLTDFYEHYDTIQSYVTKYYTDSKLQPELMVNEYARHYDIGAPGGLIKWLSMFEDKDMSGCMAYWAMANSLNEIAADQNSPSSSWWVYHWYAQMTGAQCPMTYPKFDKTRFYGVSSYDDEANMGYVLFGGSEDEHGTEVVYLDNISSTNLCNANDAVNVKLYAVSFSGQQGANYTPQTIFNGAVRAQGNALRLQVNDTDEMDAFFAVLTKPQDDAEIIDMDNITIPTLSYEAEDAILIGGATAYQKLGWATFATSGRADVGNINNNGDGVQFNINVPEDGVYTASLFYSLQSPYVNPKTLEPDSNGQNRGIGKTLPYGISVDGKRLDDIYLESTISWAYKNHCDVDIPLTAGEHTITYTHINGDERNRGNLQLCAALDKLDLNKITDISKRNDFEIDLSEMSNFKDGNAYTVTAVAPVSGYYAINADCEVALARQSIDYAPDAKTYSEISTFNIPIEGITYLSKGANTIIITGDASKITFEYKDTITTDASTVISADEITLHGNNPEYKSSTYANSGKVISSIGIGQKPAANDNGTKNYIEFKLNTQTAGYYNFAVRYSNDEPAPVMLKADGSTYIHPYNIDLVERYAQITVNGSQPETVYFRNTMSWDTFRTVDVQLMLKAGENIIRLYNDNSYQFSSLVNSTAPEIDTITVSKLSYDGNAVDKIKKTSTAKHSYTSKSVTTKATISSNGKVTTTYTCNECGYNYSKVTSTIYSPKTITLSATNYTYDGKVKTPKVTVKDSKGKAIAASNYTVTYASGRKNVGKYAVKITFKGNYSGTKTLYFTIKPKNTSISGITAGSKKFTVKIKKYTTQTTGYQIQYATNTKFTKAKTVTVGNKTTSKTISKLASKKKYYVRIRTYKTVGGTKYYSAWSKYKAVTTKK